MDALGEAAMSYCNIRLIIGGVFGILIAIALYYGAYYVGTSESMDTSFYLPVQGVRKSRELRRVDNKDVYESTYTYIVAGNSYEAIINGDNYTDNQELYYNPKSPANYTFDLGGESKLASILSIVATVVALTATLGILFRKNKFFCGMTVANDVMKTLRD